jgi:hypothetical protein
VFIVPPDQHLTSPAIEGTLLIWLTTGLGSAHGRLGCITAVASSATIAAVVAWSPPHTTLDPGWLWSLGQFRIADFELRIFEHSPVRLGALCVLGERKRDLGLFLAKHAKTAKKSRTRIQVPIGHVALAEHSSVRLGGLCVLGERTGPPLSQSTPGGYRKRAYRVSERAAAAMSSAVGMAFFSRVSLKAMGTFLPATRLMGASR